MVIASMEGRMCVYKGMSPTPWRTCSLGLTVGVARKVWSREGRTDTYRAICRDRQIERTSYSTAPLGVLHVYMPHGSVDTGCATGYERGGGRRHQLRKGACCIH